MTRYYAGVSHELKSWVSSA